MIGGTQTLDAVLAAARALEGKFDVAFDVPVLWIASDEDAEWDDSTDITSPSAPPAGPPAAADPLMALVVPLQSRFPVAGDERLSFGRSPVCDVVLPFASVSKHHGYLSRSAEQWAISDVGSRNGTRVLGVRVGPTPVPVADGGWLEIGKISARLFGVKAFHQTLRQRLGLAG